MVYRVIKTIKGIAYLYEQESYREGGKVKTRCRYIGRADMTTDNGVNTTNGNTPTQEGRDALSRRISKRLHSNEFVTFISGNEPGFFPVAVATSEITAILKAKSPLVYLSQATLLSHRDTHQEITQERYIFLQTLLNEGQTIQDRTRHVIVYGEDGNWWVAILKGTAKGEIFLQSYHRSNPDHVRRIKKRGSKPLP